MAKYCGGAMAITVLFRTTISDLLCADCSAWAHVVLVTVSCCPILRSESWDKTHLHHLQTGQLAAFRKSDIEHFFASKTMHKRFKQNHKMRLLARLSQVAPVSGASLLAPRGSFYRRCWLQQPPWLRVTQLNAEGTGSETKLNKYWGTQSAASWPRAAVTGCTRADKYLFFPRLNNVKSLNRFVSHFINCQAFAAQWLWPDRMHYLCLNAPCAFFGCYSITSIWAGLILRGMWNDF